VKAFVALYSGKCPDLEEQHKIHQRRKCDDTRMPSFAIYTEVLPLQEVRLCRRRFGVKIVDQIIPNARTLLAGMRLRLANTSHGLMFIRNVALSKARNSL